MPASKLHLQEQHAGFTQAECLSGVVLASKQKLSLLQQSQTVRSECGRAISETPIQREGRLGGLATCPQRWPSPWASFAWTHAHPKSMSSLQERLGSLFTGETRGPGGQINLGLSPRPPPPTPMISVSNLTSEGLMPLALRWGSSLTQGLLWNVRRKRLGKCLAAARGVSLSYFSGPLENHLTVPLFIN